MNFLLIECSMHEIELCICKENLDVALVFQKFISEVIACHLQVHSVIHSSTELCC